MSNLSFVSCNTELALILTQNNVVTKVNDTFVQLTGYNSSFVVNKSIDELFALLKLEFPINSQNCSYSADSYILTKHMQTKDVHVQTSRCYDPNERLYLLNENTELDLDEYFTKIEQTYKNGKRGLAIYSVPELTLLKANNNHIELLRGSFNSFAEVFAKPLYGLVDDDHYPVLKQAINNCIYSESQVRIKEVLYKYNGIDAFLDLFITPITCLNRVKYVAILSIDVTDKVREREIKGESTGLFNVFALPVIRLSYSDLTIMDINNTAATYLENVAVNKSIDKNRMKGKGLHELLPQSELVQYDKYIQEMYISRKTLQINKHRVFHNNTAYYFNFIFQPIFDSSKNINELLVTIIDVTKETEQELLMEKAMRMKDDFISFVSHEFKTPLTVIYTAVQAIELIHKKELPQKSIKYIDKIHQNTLRQIRLVNNLLDITRSEAGYLKVCKHNADIVSISRAIVDSVSIYAEEKSIKLKFKSLVTFKIIGIDVEKYERILLNLLSNAIKFTPPGKCVHTIISLKNSKVCIEVKDEGIGIPNEKLSIIFDRFGQVESKLAKNSEGTGIGLYLVKQLTTALDGDIIVESTENKGSSFKLFLKDSIIPEETEENLSVSSCNGRLMNSTAIEFSDIYSL